MSGSILNVKNLTTTIGKGKDILKVVDNVSFNIEKGEIVGLVGESGCGKSMTAMSVLGLLPKRIGKIASGTIDFNKRNLTNLSPKELRKLRGREMSVIFQEPMTSLNPILTIGDQIGELFKNHFNFSRKERREKMVDLLKKVGFPRAENILDEYPHQLSGGMRQRVMIAMAIACNPKLIIADEPTTALDVTIQAEILHLLKELTVENDTSLLLITHDLGVVAEMCDRIIVMYAGQIVEEGFITDFFKNPQHPYSKGLLDSIPKPDLKDGKLSFIKGNVPHLNELPKGCRFNDRCPYAMDICKRKSPPLFNIDEIQHARCWLFEEGENMENKKDELTEMKTLK